MSSSFEIPFLWFLNRITVPYFLLSSVSLIKRNRSKVKLRKYVFAGSFHCFKISIKNALLLMPLQGFFKYNCFENLKLSQ